ncbi:hypothetical protein F0U61_18115 [Archangium violaceum]|uniref:hypothetical protein n=1 Tax=Archangium violaceum TaxID=83451 RepID=UPI002B308411|nr:hypothetical protein F0U61_18115 [Archangium violaceum]
MKILWCWRCKMEVPMLDEDEFASAWQQYEKRLAIQKGLQPMPEEDEQLTGFIETNPNLVLHHRVSLYGPPCITCGKPLRTHQARHCAACGAPRGGQPG